MIVADATPLIHLSRIEKLSLLRRVFTKIIIPEAVYQEVVIKGREKFIISAETIARQQWIIKKRLSQKQQEEAKDLLRTANIGAGEAEAIILAKAENVGIIIDDIVGVKIAQSFGLETYWTTSVIFKAVAEKKLKKSEAREIIESLIRTGYRLKSEVLLEILKKIV